MARYYRGFRNESTGLVKTANIGRRYPGSKDGIPPWINAFSKYRQCWAALSADSRRNSALNPRI